MTSRRAFNWMAVIQSFTATIMVAGVVVAMTVYSQTRELIAVKDKLITEDKLNLRLEPMARAISEQAGAINWQTNALDEIANKLAVSLPPRPPLVREP